MPIGKIIKEVEGKEQNTKIPKIYPFINLPTNQYKEKKEYKK